MRLHQLTNWWVQIAHIPTRQWLCTIFWASRWHWLCWCQWWILKWLRRCARLLGIGQWNRTQCDWNFTFQIFVWSRDIQFDLQITKSNEFSIKYSMWKQQHIIFNSLWSHNPNRWCHSWWDSMVAMVEFRHPVYKFSIHALRLVQRWSRQLLFFPFWYRRVASMFWTQQLCVKSNANDQPECCLHCQFPWWLEFSGRIHSQWLALIRLQLAVPICNNNNRKISPIQVYAVPDEEVHIKFHSIQL